MTNVMAIFFSIICMIESSNGKQMVNKAERSSVGWTGMRPIAVDDCNRILGEQVYSYRDRMDRDKCEAMFNILVNHYLGPNPTLDEVCRMWYRGRSRMYAPDTADVTEYLRKAQEIQHAFTSVAGANIKRDAGKVCKAKSSHTRSQRGRR